VIEFFINLFYNNVLNNRLRDPQVFYLIQRYGLFEEIKVNIEELMHLSMSEALRLYLRHKDRIQPHLVVDQLEGNRYYLFMVHSHSLVSISTVTLYKEFVRNKSVVCLISI